MNYYYYGFLSMGTCLTMLSEVTFSSPVVTAPCAYMSSVYLSVFVSLQSLRHGRHGGLKIVFDQI